MGEPWRFCVYRPYVHEGSPGVRHTFTYVDHASLQVGGPGISPGADDGRQLAGTPPAGKPVHITEFNSSYRPDNPIHDTAFHAAYLAPVPARLGETVLAKGPDHLVTRLRELAQPYRRHGRLTVDGGRAGGAGAEAGTARGDARGDRARDRRERAVAGRRPVARTRGAVSAQERQAL
jgi:hypothetical protein